MARKRPKKIKKRNRFYAPLMFIVICAALVFGISVFFRVSTVEVEGADFYDEQEVVDASGIESGDNLFFINRFTAESRIYAKLPYVQSVSVSRKLPNRIVIEVKEAKAVAYVSIDGEYWLLDKNCKLLGSATVSEVQGIISVSGITPKDPVVGEKLVADSGDSTSVQYVADMLGAMTTLDIIDDVTYIDMSNISDPSFDYLGRFTVKLGRDDSVDYKLELLLSAVSQLEDADEGLIDLSIDKKAHFSPY
jgi:cell division protein FtsQ